MSTVGFHFQREVDRWLDAVKMLPPGTVVKAVDQVQMLELARLMNPNIKTVLRHWYDSGQQFDGGKERNIERARRFFSTFIDGTFDKMAYAVDFVEEFNEYYGNSQSPQEKAAILDWVWAVNKVWSEEYRSKDKYKHIRLITGNTAIGNDIPIEAAQIVYQHVGALGYHAYIAIDSLNSSGVPQDQSNNFNPGWIHPGDWRWYSGRWADMDRHYRANGIYVEWIFTEGGPIERRADGGLDPQNGWRHPNVFNGNVDKYIKSLEYWVQNTREWNARHNNRAHGVVLFTTGGGEKLWKFFETKQPEMDKIALWIKSFSYQPIQSPPEQVSLEPPPPLPITNEVTIERVDDSMPWIEFPLKSESYKVRLEFYNEGHTQVSKVGARVPFGAKTARIIPQIQTTTTTGNSLGVDISHWQGDVDFNKMKSQGVAFCFMKATQGTRHKDVRFLEYFNKSGEVGLYRGAYHFYENGNTGVTQARHFVATVPDEFDGIYIADIEHTTGTTDMDDVSNFLEEIEQLTGRKPFIYTGGWWWNSRGGVQGWEMEYPLWVARYAQTMDVKYFPQAWLSSEGVPVYHIWQYTNKGDGKKYGVSSTFVDLNVSVGHISKYTK